MNIKNTYTYILISVDQMLSYSFQECHSLNESISFQYVEDKKDKLWKLYMQYFIVIYSKRNNEIFRFICFYVLHMINYMVMQYHMGSLGIWHLTCKLLEITDQDIILVIKVNWCLHEYWMMNIQKYLNTFSDLTFNYIIFRFKNA